LVHSFFEDGGLTYMYTANDAVMIQNPFEAGTTKDLSVGAVRAVTCDVNQAEGLLVVGGPIVIEVYSLEDPLSPVILES
jgi:hypothetical protein